jgi:carboxymethylenebutenolidase
MNSLTNALVTEDTAAWLGFLDAQDKVRPGGIGRIGYCMSGPYVTTAAARFPNRFAASASLYGVGVVTNAEDSPHLLIDRIRGEMYFGFAETDEGLAHPMKALAHCLKAIPSSPMQFASQ